MTPRDARAACPGSRRKLTMAKSSKNSDLFDLERQGHTIIVVPVMDMREFEFERILYGAKQVFELLENGRIKNVIMDFNKRPTTQTTSPATSLAGRGEPVQSLSVKIKTAPGILNGMADL